MAVLFHVSDRPATAVFEPRRVPADGAGAPLVWAVDAAHLASHLLPRDCPRVVFAAAAESSARDCERFLGLRGAQRVIAIEAAWFDTALRTPLWIYEFAPEPFVCADANAGYFVSAAAVIPLGSRAVERPLDALLATGAELRVLPSLTALAEVVAASTLSFSCIRMRNAGRGSLP